MKFKKLFLLTVAVITVLSLSSCIKITYTHETTESHDIIIEPATETVEAVTEKVTHETEPKDEFEQSFILNKNTKKYHNEDCRYVGFMNEENKIFVTSTPEKLQSKSYEPCYFCQE